MRFKLLILCLIPVALIAQIRKPVPDPPKSPNVSAMERYGNFEVDLFRGLPDISIPLYEIKTRHHTVPVTLSYHASGIKVTDVASWAGLGWSVNTGGFVGRKIKGQIDEVGYLKPDFYLRKPNEINPYDADGYYYLTSILNNSMDNQPDVFSYKVPGKYGHFFYTGHAAPPVTVPYDPVKITRTMDPVYSAEIAHFQLTDESGKKYVFGNTNGETIVESSVTQRGGSSTGHRSAWQLTTMNSADNTDSVLFRYQPSESMTLFVEMEDNFTAVGNIQRNTYDCNVFQSVTQGGAWVSYNASQRLLKEILYDNGKVEFVLSPANRNDLPSKALEKINVYGKEKGGMKLLRTIQFHQTYFGGSQPRLRLDSVSIMSASATEKMVYRFTYETNDVVPLNSRSKDYWGYYNGTNNTTLVPGEYTWFPYGSRQLIGGHPDARKPNPSYVQMAILRRIQFPTGGYTLFNYEPHQYDNGVGTPTLGGGVRIKSIFSYQQENGQPIVKTYTYGGDQNEESGNGILNSVIPIQFKFMEGRHELWGLSVSGVPLPLCQYTTRVYSSNPTVDNNDYDGTMVYYPFVTEYLGTPGNTTGKRTYKYSYAPDQLIATIPEFMPGTLTAHWKRGHLERQKEYKQTSPITFELKKDIIHEYAELNTATYPDVGCLVAERFIRSGMVPENAQLGFYGDLPYVYTFYSLNTGAYKRVGTIETIYENGQSLINKTKINYNGYLQPGEITTINSKGDTTFQISRYANQYATGNASDDAALGIKKLLESNVISLPVETFKGIRKTGSAIVTGGQIRTFFSDKPVMREEFMMETAVPLTSYTVATIDASGNFIPPSVYKRRLTFSALDSRNNPIEYYTDDAGLRHNLTWGHNGTLMTSKADQPGQGRVAYTSFEDTDRGGWGYNESAVKILPAATVSGIYAYDFSVSNVISISVLPAGVYQVSYWSQTACTVNNLAPTSIGPANAKGLKLHTHEITIPPTGGMSIISTTAQIDELRLTPAGAVLKTIAYHPSGDVATEVNERNNVTNYEFDGLQRLKLVRDDNNRILRQFAYDLDKGGGLSSTLPITYFNSAATVVLKRNNCLSTEYGTEVTYTVPEGTFMSFVSKAAADAQATSAIAQNSQNYANTYGECRPKTEVIWEPYGLYCQMAVDYGPEPVTSSYSIASVMTEPGTDNVTKYTVTRQWPEAGFGATLRLVMHFAGGGYSDMPITLGWSPNEEEKTGTVFLSPQQTSFRNGMSLVSVERVGTVYFTRWQIYGQRRKKVGGEVVVVEANTSTGGQGPYFPPKRVDATTCSLPITPGPNVFLSAEMTGNFVKTCPAGQIAAGIYYTLPMGTIQSTVSQEDADAQARVIWQTNGQQQANQAVCR